MAKYIMVYKMAEPFDFSSLPEAEIMRVSAMWGEWLGTLGSKLVDGGKQFKFGGKSVSSKGTEDSDNLLSGYSIVEASDVHEALDIAKGSPILLNGGSVEVYEAFGGDN